MKRILSKFQQPNPLTITMGVTLVIVLIYLINTPFLQLMELKTLDLRFLYRGQIKPGADVVLAVVDEKSLEELGRWPWPRTVLARLVDFLSSAGVKTISFDIGFFEPDEKANLPILRSLREKMRNLGVVPDQVQSVFDQAAKEMDTDRQLAESLQKSKSDIVLGYFFHMSSQGITHLSQEVVKHRIAETDQSKYKLIRYQSQKAAATPFVKAYMPQANLKMFRDAAKTSGYFNMFPDEDGTVRWVPLVIQCDDDLYAPLSMQTLWSFRNYPEVLLQVAEFGLEKIQVGQISIPTDEKGKLFINYRGGPGTFLHYSITDILHDRLSPELFKGKIVLIGATAVGIYDMRVTPFSNVFPGLEIHANVIDNIIKGDFLTRPTWASIFDVLAMLVIGLALGLILPRIGAVQGAVVTQLILFGYIAFCQFLFTKYGLWINIVHIMLQLILGYTAYTLYRYLAEEREKKKIRGAFAHYVSAQVVNEMLKNPDKLKLGGEKLELTVLFSDIRGFTSISESMSPEDLVHLLNEYLTVMTDRVLQYDGTLDKYMGDAIMAFYGAPIQQSDHSARACHTALEMMADLRILQQKWKEQGIPMLDIGIGINTGPMSVGNMGSNIRFDYTVMGDNVNLGSRLEGANKTYGSHIIISEFTFEHVREQFLCRELDAVKVKGKNKPVRVFELMGPNNAAPELKRLADMFNLGVTYYRNQLWDRALAAFTEIAEAYPQDEPTFLYLSRVATLKANPPPDYWDGVFEMKTK
ncbi:MAG: adenylate/guanylate cyclase domain-containing protein [Deltaproteobacteria bacterium]|nr:adenylate/guanylate cyclase domain-containing protein [Deltaproteobacteria bacterium]